MQNLDTMDAKKRQFSEALKTHYGIISAACKSVDISRQTYYNWRNNDQEFAFLCDEALEYTADFVENQLLSRIAKEDTTAIIFYCKTKLKNRGYVERIEQTGLNGGPIRSETKIASTDQDILDRYFYQRLERERQ